MPTNSFALAFECETAPDIRMSSSPALLSDDAFTELVANAPLISLDLIVEDMQGAVLLGLRSNPPAQGCWFVPGGRVRKNETLDAAFARIAHDELGLQASRSEQAFAGVYEHFYDVNFNGTPNASTHYIVLAYRLRITSEALHLPLQQHSRYQWMQPQQIARHPDVHSYTKAYFELT